MTEDSDVDPAELRAELDQIKAAMGIEERYSGAPVVWLLFGIGVPIAAALSQYVHTNRLAMWYHSVIWLGVLGGVFAVYAIWTDDGPEWGQTPAGAPRLWLQFLIVYLASVPLQTIASAYGPELGYVADSARSFAIILVVLGVAYGILGSSMRALHVRARDRYVFYVGTVWMVALGVAITQVPVLAEWAYAVFGGAYFVYAVAAYALIRSTADGASPTEGSS